MKPISEDLYRKIVKSSEDKKVENNSIYFSFSVKSKDSFP